MQKKNNAFDGSIINDCFISDSEHKNQTPIISLEQELNNSINQDYFDFEPRENTTINAEKNKWLNYLSAFFRFCSNSNRRYVYFTMYQMYSKLGLNYSLDVLIDVVKLNERKSVVMGVLYSLPFFSNFEMRDENFYSLVSLIEMIVDVDNEMIDAELESVLELFLDLKMMDYYKKNKHIKPINLIKLEKMWEHINNV